MPQAGGDPPEYGDRLKQDLRARQGRPGLQTGGRRVHEKRELCPGLFRSGARPERQEDLGEQ